ncbi:SgcJ/EcaC family oxidoreductase [Streptomyces sp. NPDC004732]|uniref:SgcJ/EcaC family oxidoreductase n=1 Tax=Streptomyces sp. NPDC004732 TaxID=3154290 RepID=UPI0033A35903
MRTDTSSAEATRAAELAAIRQVVADASEFQDDVERFIPLFTADTTVVNFGGRRVAGRDTLADAMRQALASSLADVVTTLEEEDIRFLRADVAIVASIKHVSDRRQPGADGESVAPLHASSGRLTHVLVKEGDDWRIASSQTTPILG